MANPTPRRIILISRGRREEAVADQNCWPGMLLDRRQNGTVAPKSGYGAGGPVYVAIEDALRGVGIDAVLPAGEAMPYQVAAKGDKLLLLLATGQSVVANTPLLSNGDGTLVAEAMNPLQVSDTDSTVVTNTVTETTFSNGSYTIAANTLQVGQTIKIAGTVKVVAQHASDTHRIKIYLGATVLLDFTALNLPAGSILNYDLTLFVNIIGASGSVTGVGTYSYGNPLTPTVTNWTLAATTVDTTATQLVAVKTTASVADTGNQIKQSNFKIEQSRQGGYRFDVISDEAINNTSGTGTSGYNDAAFIRCMVI